jgi:hypothetical protein
LKVVPRTRVIKPTPLNAPGNPQKEEVLEIGEENPDVTVFESAFIAGRTEVITTDFEEATGYALDAPVEVTNEASVPPVEEVHGDRDELDWELPKVTMVSEATYTSLGTDQRTYPRDMPRTDFEKKHGIHDRKITSRKDIREKSRRIAAFTAIVAEHLDEFNGGWEHLDRPANVNLLTKLCEEKYNVKFNYVTMKRYAKMIQKPI